MGQLAAIAIVQSKPGERLQRVLADAVARRAPFRARTLGAPPRLGRRSWGLH